MRPSPSSGKLGDIFLKVKKDSLRAVEGPLAEVLNLDLETDREFPVGLKVVFLIGLAVKVEGGVFPFIPAKEALKAIEDLKAINLHFFHQDHPLPLLFVEHVDTEEGEGGIRRFTRAGEGIGQAGDDLQLSLSWMTMPSSS